MPYTQVALRENDNEKKICKIYHIFVKQFEILDYKLLPFLFIVIVVI